MHDQAVDGGVWGRQAGRAGAAESPGSCRVGVHMWETAQTPAAENPPGRYTTLAAENCSEEIARDKQSKHKRHG